MKRRSILIIGTSLAFIGMHFSSVTLSPLIVIPMFSPSMMVFGTILGIGGVVIGIMDAIVNK